MKMRHILPVALAAFFAAYSPVALASFYDGGGVLDGILQALNFQTGELNLRTLLLFIFLGILCFVGFVAVIVIIIAGIILVVAGSSDEWRGRALNIIFYALIGLILIIFAASIVTFILRAGNVR